MAHLSNYLRAHRKSSGLSQRDIARLLGGGSGAKVSGYEQFKRTPTLLTALKLQAIFNRPVAELFEGMFKDAEQAVARNAQGLLERSTKRQGDTASPRHRRLKQLADSLTHQEDVPF